MAKYLFSIEKPGFVVLANLGTRWYSGGGGQWERETHIAEIMLLEESSYPDWIVLRIVVFWLCVHVAVRKKGGETK